MRGLLFPIGALALAPAAHAECVPSFVEGSNVVTITPAGLDTPQVTERFYVRLRNAGDTVCELKLAVGRDIAASSASFPNYTLTGPFGNLQVTDSSAAAANTSSSSDVIVPAGGEVSVPYDIRLNVGWGSEAGDYDQQLEFYLLSRATAEQLGVQRTQLSLTVPTVARIRFAGASGAGGPARVEMGTLSPLAPTVSPPFAIRVLSTSGYQMQLASQNAGALQRDGGSERIPYRMTVDGRLLNLSGGGDMINVGNHTGSTGDVHPVSIVIDPDATRHAGNYDDRVTVTVTPI